MKYILVNLSHDNNVGFGNQIYMMAHAIHYAIENKINILFFSQFLNQINTNSYSNISDIIDIKLTNEYLSKYNVQIADYNNFNFYLTSLRYGYENFYIDIFDSFKDSKHNNNNIFSIDTQYSFLKFNIILRDKYKNYAIPIQKNLCKLELQYSLDNITKTITYNLIDNHLENDIVLNFNNIQNYNFSVFCYTPLYLEIRTNIVFKKHFKDNAISFFKNNKISLHQNINCIHLRLENDAIEHWSKENNISPHKFKEIIEQKYISNIFKYINKNDITIILSSDYNNNVINFLQGNQYNILTTPQWSPYRDISAIYDLHIADYCNNTYIGVYESSFSYLILFRIKSHIKNYCEIKYIDN